MVELGLIAALGFLGSFGHCVGMCGPIAVAFALAANRGDATTPGQQFRFHLLLNLGRLCSYVLVGIAIGGLGSVLVAGGQMAGVGSVLRRGMALVTGSLLIGLGMRQVAPQALPNLPFLHPLQGRWHDRLQRIMQAAAQQNHWWTPMALGLVWGLVPCGFLYTAQIKAAATSSLWSGAATMLAFGLGTLPTMLGLGLSSTWLSRDRRSQLFQMGGWITLLIGILVLTRTGDLMVDYTGHLAWLCLGLALIARPISQLWSYPLRCRRVLGVGAFLLAIAHTLHVLQHSWNWQLMAVRFMLPQHQWGIVAGGLGLMLMTPLALTSTDWAQQQLGRAWRSLHRLSLPAWVLCGGHAILVGPSYGGSLEWSGWRLVSTILLTLVLGGVLAVRSRTLWACFGLAHRYTPPRIRRPRSPLNAVPQCHSSEQSG